MIKVCIVDDEFLIREGLKHIIRWEDHGIDIAGEASNGSEALELIERTRPDLLLTDVKMPKMDGLALIKEARARYPQLKFVIISGYDDFHYVKQAVLLGIENYLLKPINELELSESLLSIIEKIESERVAVNRRKDDSLIIRDNIVHRLLTGRIGAAEAEEKLRMLDISLEARFYSVVIVRLLQPPAYGDELPSGMALDRLWNRHARQFAAMRHYSLIDINGQLIVMFGHDLLSDLDRIEERLKEFVTSSALDEGHELFVTIGETQRSLGAVQTSYEHASRLQHYYYICPSGSVIREGALESREKMTAKIDLEALEEPILHQQPERIRQYFHRLYHMLFFRKGITTDYVRGVSIELLAYLIHIAKSRGFSVDELAPLVETTSKQLFQAGNLSEALKRLEAAALQLSEWIADQENDGKPSIRRIIRFVEENYQREFSLKTLSNEFNISAAYLGQLFKRETGMLFTDYLHSVRIAKAKRLLESTTLKANEVAEKVGYGDSNYFYKLFRKYAGVYISDYLNEIGHSG